MSSVAGIAELSKELAAKRGIPLSEAKSVMRDVVDVMGSAIVSGGVSLKGVMTITPVVRKGRKGKISFGDKKGQEWETEDKIVLSIKTGCDMEAQLNK